MIMSSAHFRTQTGVRTKAAFMKAKSSDALIAIHNGLNGLETGDYPKFDPRARWKHMFALAGRCESYLKRKEGKGRDVTKPKHRCIDELSVQLVRQMVKEMQKAAHYGRQVTQYDRIATALPLGRNNPQHGKVKFELALGGKGGTVVNGQSLWEAAHDAGIALTGNDTQDAYILRSWLKSLARANRLDKHTLTPLEYADAEQRQRYLLSFDQAICSQNGAPFDTTAGFTIGEDGAGPCVVSEGGEWYAKAGEFATKAFHHSSFLSGAPVMLAGTMRVAGGKLQYISNNSGHYAPRIADLVNGAAQLRQSGLDAAALQNVSVLASDFEGRYGPAEGARFLFPYASFVKLQGNVPNPQNYEIFSRFDKLHWANPDAPRPGHPATVGQRTRDGVQVVFPA
jgi:hypothetical protein